MALSEAESALNVHADGEVVLNVGNSRTSLRRESEGEKGERKDKQFPRSWEFKSAALTNYQRKKTQKLLIFVNDKDKNDIQSQIAQKI